jgi:hypothetical protein
MSGAASRKLPYFIEAFLEYTDGLPSPEPFRLWSAIACLAGAMERKVWVRTNMSDLYPNLYTVLVAGPGVGKTIALAKVEDLWRNLDDHHVAPTSVTKASLVDAIGDAVRRVVIPGGNPPYAEFNSLLVLAGELGVLIPAYDNEFMNALTAIYDGYPYSERRRTKDHKLHIEHPQLNLFGATTPSYLNAVMPAGAWDQGFISRTILIHSSQRIIRPLFEENQDRPELRAALLHDIKVIGGLYGKTTFESEAIRLVSDWHMAGGPPIPDHPKLQHYLTRRSTHLLKLCLISAVSRSDFSFTVAPADVQVALTWLLEAEQEMPAIFSAMTGSGDAAQMDECFHFLWSIFKTKGRPFAEHEVINFLRQRVPAHSVMKVIDVMVKGGMLRAGIGTDGKLAYVPTPPPGSVRPEPQSGT